MEIEGLGVKHPKIECSVNFCDSNITHEGYSGKLDKEQIIEMAYQDCRIYLRSQIISKMLHYVRNERFYIEYFTRLLGFEDALKCGPISDVSVHKYLCTFPHDLPNTPTKTKSKGKRGKHSAVTSTKELRSNSICKDSCNKFN